MSIDLSLDRLRNFLPHLPVEYHRPTIHIAGTNGKGSISAIVSSILLSSSPPLSVGRYNSPHLTKITDCITLNGDPVHDDTYQQTQAEIKALAVEKGIPLSPFEVETLTALEVFEKTEVDVAVIEVGMGGRLDATNIIPTESVLVSALSTVDFDHQDFLGTTVEAIAKEKAGIARRGKPFVVGRQQHSTVESVVREVLEGADAVFRQPISVKRLNPPTDTVSLRLLNSDVNVRLLLPTRVQFNLPSLGDEPITTSFSLPGDHQLDNLSTSLGIIESILRSPAFSGRITIDSIQRGVAKATWRGRLSWHTLNLARRSHPILVDGAHNPGSSQALSKYIRYIVSHLEPPTNLHLHYILGVSHSPLKSPRETLLPLLTDLPANVGSVDVHLVHFTLPDQMPWVKPVAPLDLASVVRGLNWKADVHAPKDGKISDTNEELLEALQRISSVIDDDDTRTNSTPHHHLIVLAGSLYLVADFYRFLDSKRV